MGGGCWRRTGLDLCATLEDFIWTESRFPSWMKNYREKKHCQFREGPCSPAAWSLISYCLVSHWTQTPELKSCVWSIHLPQPSSVVLTHINCQVILFPTSSTANACNKSYTKQMCHTHKLEAKLELQTMPVNFSAERGPVKDKMAKQREKNRKLTIQILYHAECFSSNLRDVSKERQVAQSPFPNQSKHAHRLGMYVCETKRARG